MLSLLKYLRSSFTTARSLASATANSAIPIPEIPQNPIPKIDPKSTAAILEILKASFAYRQTKPSFRKEEGEKDEKISTFISADETSVSSEICSVSETILMATIAEKRDGEENGGDEVKMRPKELVSPAKIQRKRSFFGDSAGRIKRRAKSPVRRSESSPVRSTHVHEMGQTNRSWTSTGSTRFRRNTTKRRFCDFGGSLELEWAFGGSLEWGNSRIRIVLFAVAEAGDLAVVKELLKYSSKESIARKNQSRCNVL